MKLVFNVLSWVIHDRISDGGFINDTSHAYRLLEDVQKEKEMVADRAWVSIIYFEPEAMRGRSG